MNAGPRTSPSGVGPRPAPRSNLLVRLLFWPFVLTSLGLYIIWRLASGQAVARLEEAARDRGEPITIAELAATYPEVPPGSNAYSVLLDLWRSEDPEYWEAFEKKAGALPEPRHHEYPDELPVLGSAGKVSRTNRLSEASLKAAEEFLSAQADHLAALREALERPAFRAPVAFQEGFAMLVPHLAAMKSEAQILWIAAVYAAEQGQTDEALQAISDLARIGHLLGDDPLLIGQLVRLACGTMVVDSIERLVTQQSLDEGELRRLAEVLNDLDAHAGLKGALIGERVLAFSIFEASTSAVPALREPSSDDDDYSSPQDIRDRMRFFRYVGWANAEKRLMGETFEEALRIVEKPDFATNDQLHEVFANMNRRARRFPPKLITLMLMPALEKAGEKFAVHEASRRCALTALAIEGYRIRHGGTLPERLADLPPESLAFPSTDPFDGQPLRYVKASTGFRVYSVGPDRRDNGGLLDRPRRGSAPRQFDIGFGVERPNP